MKQLIISLLIAFLLVSIFLFYFAYQNFLGGKIYYLFFSFVSIFSTIFSFRKKGFFFEKFLSVYLFLGFWLKFTLFIGLFINFPPAIGIENFEFSREKLNELMILSSIPFISLTFSSLLINKFKFSQHHLQNKTLKNIYKEHRLLILSLIVLLVFIISSTNYYFGIYQKGLISKLDVPFLISGFYKWFYLIGSGSIIAIILKFEFDNFNKISNKIYIIILFESFLSSITYLSRAVIFNVSSIFYGTFKSLSFKKNQTLEILKLSIFYFCVIIILGISLIFVEKIRASYFFTDEKIELESKEKITEKDFLKNLNSEQIQILDKNFETSKEKVLNKISENFLSNKFIYKSLQLIYIRFIGIESLMIVSSYNQLNFQNFNEAFNEKINFENYNHYYTKYVLLEDENSKATFDRKKKNQKKEQYTIHVPGIVAFLFYGGSKSFLFISLIALSIIFFLFERFVYYCSSGNLILTAFISHIICYRLIHFGYVPIQSYLFFGSLILTIFTIFLFHKFLK